MGRKRRRTREEIENDLQWWEDRGMMLDPGLGSCFMKVRKPRLEELDQQGAWRAYSLDWSSGMLTMVWRRPG